MRQFIFAALVLFCASSAWAATAVATYQFNNTLTADQASAPTLTIVDPLGLSGFQADAVLGANRPVWHFDGATPNAQQAGFTVTTSGLIGSNNYSVDLVFQFNERVGLWRRIIDVEDRKSDNGFYVNPSNNLAIYPVSGSTNAWTNDVYHHVVLTNNGGAVVTYIDGISQFTTNTTLMNLANPNNPNLLMGFFIDNVLLGGQNEYSDGKIAYLRLWNGVLNPSEAHAIATDPFVNIYSKGDFNRDGLVNVEDISAMLKALTDLNAYKTARVISEENLVKIGDFTSDNKVTNADIQPFLNLLVTEENAGSISAVPEPASAVLFGGLLAALLAMNARRRRR